jgi:hypothetical protein
MDLCSTGVALAQKMRLWTLKESIKISNSLILGNGAYFLIFKGIYS